MTLNEINDTVKSGAVVHWKSEKYTVLYDSQEDRLVIRDNHYGYRTPLVEDDGTMNGHPSEFYATEKVIDYKMTLLGRMRSGLAPWHALVVVTVDGMGWITDGQERDIYRAIKHKLEADPRFELYEAITQKQRSN